MNGLSTADTTRATCRRPGARPSVLAALVVLWLVAAAHGCSERHAPAPAAAAETVTVELATAGTLDAPRDLVAGGTVRPKARVAPGSRILGRVARVTVREGDRVRAGQLLVTLEKNDLEAAVRQAAAAVAMAEAQLENARAQKERFDRLHARGSVTARNLEDAVAAFRVAEAALDQARANESAARVTLGDAEIVAPFAGHVIDRLVEPGDIARPGAPLLTIDDLSRVRVSLDVPESDIAALSEDDAVTVEIDALGESIEGRVDRVVPAADPGSRTFRVDVLLDNPEGRVRSGMFARARFPRGDEPVLVVPRAAVVREGQLESLFVIDREARARVRLVRLGRELPGGVEVLSGLAPGERYVVSPPADLADGTPVAAR